MGVPKFYRWISERYPCLSEVVKEYQVPEFDNLYFDMNGIIHVCSHPNDDDPHFRITEEQIFKDIFHYIEVLFRIVCPRKVFFMAVDGVAPRAKMNQQRGRRFRSAKEAEENIKKALAKGEMLPEEKRFDSNCITPGTKFMVRLQQQLEYMVKSKVSTDQAWQGIRIYLSGHETPGEGEHKIMEFIRNERMQEDYDPNTRHCLYGLDADLMMLGLCSHEPHFSLLREEVRFTGKKKHSARTAKPEETTFHLLHLSLMREYIDHEFSYLKETLPFQYDLECIIDDWVLMGFLVGNDFIPHLPHLHIAHNALPLLYSTYKQVLPTLDGYLNEGGVVNLRRFEKYLEHLSKFDSEKFEEVFADFKWLESKVGKRKSKARQSRPLDIKKSKNKDDVNSFGSLEEESSSQSYSESDTNSEQKSIRVMTDLSIKQGLTSPDSDVDEKEDKSTYEMEFELYKRNYYQEKLHFIGTAGEVAKIAFEYVLAIQWICHYYYNGVQSWSWYYPYHYAPYLSDVRNLSKMKLTYDMAKPFLPYEQLLAVLPAASKECLPEPFWDLMSSPTSPIIDYYPTDFTCDLNGKQQEWEAVVLIPFINEDRLLGAMQPCLKKLSKTDRERNRHSGCQLSMFDSNLDYYVKSACVGTFPNIAHCKASLKILPLHAWSSTDISSFVKGVLPGCRLSVYYPGFPTLYHLPHTQSLQKRGVKVFQMPSRNENMILSINSPEEEEPDNSGRQPYSENDSIEDVAKRLLGTSIYVNWPHMEEAKVVAVSDENIKYEVTEHIHATGSKGSKHKSLTPKDQEEFWMEVAGITETLLERRGIAVGETRFLAYAQPLLGRKYICSMQGQITLEKQWATTARPYALQATVKDITVKDPSFQRFKGLDELYPIGSTVFMLGHPYYGCQGKVLQVQQGMTSLELKTPYEPDIESVFRQRQKLSMKYYHSWELGSRIGISNYLLSRITGTLFVFFPTNRKWQIGLNLRFTKESSGIAGYTKFVNREWLYSEAVEKALLEYTEKFPDVLRYLQTALHRNEDDFNAMKMTKKDETEEVIEKLKEVTTWLKTLDCYHGDKINQFSDILEKNVVQSIVQKVEEIKKRKSLKPVQISMRPHLLYRPLAHQGTLIPDKTAQHRLLDRIVNIRDSYTVPLGLRGTIIGVHRQPGQDVLHDVVFDEEFLGGLELGGRCPKRRGYRMPECAMINLSHGMRSCNKDRKPTAIVKPHHKQQNTRQNWASPRGEMQGFQGRSSGSPTHTKPDYRKQQTFRPQSANQPASNATSIMHRSSTVQQDKNYKKKPTAQQQSPAGNMFDALWITLKEENKRRTGEVDEKVNGQSSMNKTSTKAVPIITTPDVRRSEESEDPIDQEDEKLSLTQAAKSLPKVNLSTKDVAGEQTSKDAVENQGADKSLSTAPQQTSTHLITTVTQAESTSRKKEAAHLDNLFKTIHVSHSKTPSFTPRLAFTPTQVLLHSYSQPGANKSTTTFRPYSQPPYPRNPSPYSQPSRPRNPMPYMAQSAGAAMSPVHQQFNVIPPFLMRPPFYPNGGVHAPAGMPYYPFPQQPYQSGSTTPKIQSSTNEGTMKLNEMLEDEKSSKWSSGEVEEASPGDSKAEKLDNAEATGSIHALTAKLEKCHVDHETHDEDSEKDDEDFIERSASVEDESASSIQKPKNVEELFTLINKLGMMPPIYTYFTTDDEQVVSTVQLWNGMRFSSHPQKSRDKAMEGAAHQGLAFLKAESNGNRPISTSPITSVPYHINVPNIIPNQYIPAHPGYASPMPYATVPQAYYYHPNPYPMMQNTLIPDHQPLVHPSVRYGTVPSQYVHQYPYVPMTVSPHHSKPPHYVSSSSQPLAWNYHTKDSYSSNSYKPKTEFKILDKPPVLKDTAEHPDQTKEPSNLCGMKSSSVTGATNDESMQKSNKSCRTHKQESQTKAKLAISFTQGKK